MVEEVAGIEMDGVANGIFEQRRGQNRCIWTFVVVVEPPSWRRCPRAAPS
jgi:hypothetical protein